MNIVYKTNGYNPSYGAITYSIDVVCKDDGVHFPRFSYNGRVVLKESDVNKSEDELRDMVIEDLKNNYKKYNHITLDEQLEDPAFEYISLSFKKEIFYEKHIFITK